MRFIAICLVCFVVLSLAYPYSEWYRYTLAVLLLAGPALMLLLAWKMCEPRVELAMLEGASVSHREFVCGDGDVRTTLPLRMLFRKNIGKCVEELGIASLNGKFFGWRSKDSTFFIAFAFASKETVLAFPDDFDRPHPPVRILRNLGLRMGVILLPSFMNELTLSFFPGVYLFPGEAVLVAIFCALVAGYSLWRYLIQLSRQNDIYRKELEMLDQAGIAWHAG
jgi:hypothetical protein